MLPNVSVDFSVEVRDVKAWEYVYVTGNVPELGDWEPERALALEKNPSNLSEHIWNIQVDIKTDRPQMKYRYFICQFLDPYKESAVQRLMVVTKWETFIHPRIYKLGGYKGPGSKPDLFGKNGEKSVISEGWLAHQTEIRLSIQKLSFWKSRYRDRTFRVRVVPVDLRYREIDMSFDDEDESRDGTEMRPPLIPSHTQCVVAILNLEESDCNYHEQSRFGEVFDEKDQLSFRVQSVAPDFLLEGRPSPPPYSSTPFQAFRVEIYAGKSGSPGKRPAEGDMEMVGVGHLLPNAEVKNSIQSRVISVSSLKHQPVGQLTVEVFIIKPMPASYPSSNLEVSYSRYWKKRPVLEVGHRGVGVSYSKLNVAKENTIRSMAYAASHGADFVEFDVQLSKDKIPVIYHDFHVCVSIKRRQGSIQDLRALVAMESQQDSEHYELPVKDLRLSQLQLLQLKHPKILEMPSKVKELEVSEELDNQIDNQPFPTLKQVLDRVTEEVGFNIEIKSPLKLHNDDDECENFFERNIYIDEILKVVMTYASNRRIVFSSFDPYICIMVKLKQNKYPVLFLTQGITTRYPDFADKRTKSSLDAVAFVASEEILGINFHSEELLKDSSALTAAQRVGVVNFVWGDDLNTSENREYFKKADVDGIVYDRIHDRGGEKQNIFLVEKQQKEALFRSESRSRSASPTESDSSPEETRKEPPAFYITAPSIDEDAFELDEQAGARQINNVSEINE